MKPPVCAEGHYYSGRIPIMSHTLDIPRRMKEIDPRYFIMLNTRTQKYEVHVAGQRGTTLGCELPFDQLDARALEYVRRYSVERTDQTIREMDRHNERLEQTKLDLTIDRANYKMADAIRYADHHPSKDGEAIPKELIAE